MLAAQVCFLKLKAFDFNAGRTSLLFKTESL
jgi:hypothetical protein